MAVKFGAGSVALLKFGASTVSKMYLGSTSVPLPLSGDPNYSSTKAIVHLNNSLGNTAFATTGFVPTLYDLGTAAVAFNSSAAKFGTHGLRFTGVPTVTEGSNVQNYGRLMLQTANGLLNSSGRLPPAWTLEMWFKPASLWNSGRKQLAAGGDRYYTTWDLFVNGIAVNFGISWYDQTTSDTASVTVAGNVTGGITAGWHYVAVTRSGDTVKLFYDGAQLGSTGTITSGGQIDPTGALDGESAMMFGAAYDAFSSDWLYGASMDVDEIRVTHATRTITASPTEAFPDSGS